VQHGADGPVQQRDSRGRRRAGSCVVREERPWSQKRCRTYLPNLFFCGLCVSVEFHDVATFLQWNVHAVFHFGVTVCGTEPVKRTFGFESDRCSSFCCMSCSLLTHFLRTELCMPCMLFFVRHPCQMELIHDAVLRRSIGLMASTCGQEHCNRVVAAGLNYCVGEISTNRKSGFSTSISGFSDPRQTEAVPTDPTPA
jgi:hypothetical protein